VSGVLAVMDEAARDLAIYCPEADDAQHDEMLKARATVERMAESAKALADAIDDETTALVAMRGESGMHACHVTESRVIECSAALRAALAAFRGEA
jgi:hypothetical protein